MSFGSTSTHFSRVTVRFSYSVVAVRGYECTWRSPRASNDCDARTNRSEVIHALTVRTVTSRQLAAWYTTDKRESQAIYRTEWVHRSRASSENRPTHLSIHLFVNIRRVFVHVHQTRHPEVNQREIRLALRHRFGGSETINRECTPSRNR